MRPFILGSIAVGTIAFVIGCGAKPAKAPSTSTAASVADESKPVNDESKPETDNQSSPPVEQEKQVHVAEARIEAAWDSKLRYQANMPPTNCVVAGRARFFTAENESSKEATGTVTIELYDCTPQSSATEPLLLEDWSIEGDSLKHFLAENTASPEYSFMLPWGTYKADITQVRMVVKYEPKAGKMLSTKSDVLTLDHSEMNSQQ
jgi:hypothetical protein